MNYWHAKNVALSFGARPAWFYELRRGKKNVQTAARRILTQLTGLHEPAPTLRNPKALGKSAGPKILP